MCTNIAIMLTMKTDKWGRRKFKNKYTFLRENQPTNKNPTRPGSYGFGREAITVIEISAIRERPNLPQNKEKGTLRVPFS